VYSVSHQSWFLRLLADIDAEYLFEWLGFNEFLPPINSPLGKLIMELFCNEQPHLCEQVIELLCGPHRNAFNDSRMSVMVAHEPGGTSVKVRIKKLNLSIVSFVEKYKKYFNRS
jgi:hypothetical protein